ncbi:hypothetical protein AAFF_G00118150 [Aldrovandia affinis]|uniref:Uncharacterized protein n=1 Tax=Aldrovandia affinis TaxID=143900 RepID=A0AAD7WAK0_9TELE|nr:hypothetical protein AAFF_G00118150 [Aldrovandia affinis]
MRAHSTRCGRDFPFQVERGLAPWSGAILDNPLINQAHYELAVHYEKQVEGADKRLENQWPERRRSLKSPIYQ